MRRQGCVPYSSPRAHPHTCSLLREVIEFVQLRLAVPFPPAAIMGLARECPASVRLSLRLALLASLLTALCASRRTLLAVYGVDPAASFVQVSPLSVLPPGASTTFCVHLRDRLHDDFDCEALSDPAQARPG